MRDLQATDSSTSRFPGTQRLEAFSDGVFAIAITLLILDVRVPSGTEAGRLAHELGHIWPSYLSYLITFALIGIVWVNHHALMERVAVVDRGLLFINLALLGVVAALPFPAGMMGEFLADGGSNGRVAGVIYSATMFVLGLTFVALWQHLLTHPQLLVETGDGVVRSARRRALTGSVVYVAAIVVALIDGRACLVVHALVAAWFILPDRARPAEAQAGISSR